MVRRHCNAWPQCREELIARDMRPSRIFQELTAAHRSSFSAGRRGCTSGDPSKILAQNVNSLSTAPHRMHRCCS